MRHSTGKRWVVVLSRPPDREEAGSCDRRDRRPRVWRPAVSPAYFGIGWVACLCHSPTVRHTRLNHLGTFSNSCREISGTLVASTLDDGTWANSGSIPERDSMSVTHLFSVQGWAIATQPDSVGFRTRDLNLERVRRPLGISAVTWPLPRPAATAFPTEHQPR
jgi:hypothetical protein